MTHKARFAVAVTIGFIAFLFTGCATGFLVPYDYNLEVRNIGTQRITNCKVTSASGFNQSIGSLIPKAGDTTGGPFKHPYADKWTVTWKRAQGNDITKTLDLTDEFQKRFSGRLVLTIDSENRLAYFTEPFGGQKQQP